MAPKTCLDAAECTARFHHSLEVRRLEVCLHEIAELRIPDLVLTWCPLRGVHNKVWFTPLCNPLVS